MSSAWVQIRLAVSLEKFSAACQENLLPGANRSFEF
jgi:hypothetical protein